MMNIKCSFFSFILISNGKVVYMNEVSVEVIIFFNDIL